MKQIINLYKPVGLTPLEAIEKFKLTNPVYKNKKISYSGRLDPMAEGLLIILVGDENKKMKEYMKLDKEYIAEILFGFTTDTFDILGIPNIKQEIKDEISEMELIKKIKKEIKSFKGTYHQKIPVYSSYIIKGKPLFWYARNNKLNNLTIPQTNVKIKNIKILDFYNISSSKLLKEIKRKINLVNGDFRQKKSMNKWNLLLKDNHKNFKVLKVVINCSSGTYIRAIANDLGKDFGGGILLSLKRTKVGKFDVKNSERI